MEQFRLNNGEKIRGTGLAVLDLKGKQLLEAPAGATVTYVSDAPNIADFAQDPANPLLGDITTEGNDVGVANITGTLTYADGKVLSDVAQVTVINSAPGSVRFTPGTVEPE